MGDIITTPIKNDESRVTGCVKWFNNKAGFGFITACDGNLNGKDVFVHYSSIRVPNDKYKYLIQGEYVQFDISSSDKKEHEFHAINVSGINGGLLMCETRSKQMTETKSYKSKPRTYKTPDETEPSNSRKRKGHGKDKSNAK
jgi:cold shock CspA family protein